MLKAILCFLAFAILFTSSATPLLARARSHDGPEPRNEESIPSVAPRLSSPSPRPLAEIEGICGDQNRDGRATILDTIILLQIAVGLIEPSPPQRVFGDLNRDRAVNVADAVISLQQIVGLVTIAECGPTGVLLEGEPDAPALGTVLDFSTLEGVSEDEISIDESGREVARTQIEIAFVEDVTVGQVNALLESIDGRIISMLEGVLIALVGVPDPGSLETLDALVAQMEAEPIVRYVNKAYFAEPAVLPNNHDYKSAADMSMIDHHLAVRAHAAWNARAAIDPAKPFPSKPLVVIADFFGGGPPNAHTDVVDVDAAYGSGKPDSHGYHVLGILAATFDGDGSNSGRDKATGIFPNITDLRVVDIIVNATEKRTIPDIEDLIIQLVRGGGGNVVVSTSLGFSCKKPANAAANCVRAHAEPEAVTWIEKVRGTAYTPDKPSLEDKFIHITAAGNEEVAGDTDARVASSFAAAKLLPGLEDWVGFDVSNLTNTLVIENVVNGPAAPFAPICLASSSKRPGDLAGIGTNVWSLTGSTVGADNKTGTSMATPQVAGLTAYVWTMHPTLSPQHLIELLQNTARPGVQTVGNPSCAQPYSSPVIDAYAAVLAVDGPDPSPENAPVRLAILDVADGTGASGQNGVFDEKDIALFLREFKIASGGFDYSRYDLNGDGQTGTDRKERFDLDIDDPPNYTAGVNLDIENLPNTFDENSLVDMQILCYYAYSPLFTGSPEERKKLLAIHCPCDGGAPDDPNNPPKKVFDGTATVLTEADADALLCVTEITGNLFIGSFNKPSTLTNLDSLVNLKTVKGSVLITNNPQLANVDGLSSLTDVGGNITISTNNPLLANLKGLSSLTNIGGQLFIASNNVLTDVDGLSKLTTIGRSLVINGNPLLANIDGLSSLTSIGGSLEVSFNPLLTDVDGLSSVAGPIPWRLSIRRNSALTNLDGLSGITSVGVSFGDDLEISSNDVLVNVDGLNGLTSIGGRLLIEGNPLLANLDGLSNVAGPLPRDLRIRENAALKNLDGLRGVTRIGGHVSLYVNPALGDINGLSGVTSIGAYLEIIDNAALMHLDGLSSLASVGQEIRVQDNDALTSISGLRGISGAFPSSIFITRNDTLPNVDGLSNVTSVGGSLDIDGHGLASLAGLNNITKVDRDVNILVGDFSALGAFELPELTSIGNRLYIAGRNDATTGRSLTRIKLPKLVSVPTIFFYQDHDGVAFETPALATVNKVDFYFADGAPDIQWPAELALPGNLNIYNTYSPSGGNFFLVLERINGGVVIWNNGARPDGDTDILLHFNDGVGFIEVRDNNPGSLANRVNVTLGIGGAFNVDGGIFVTRNNLTTVTFYDLRVGGDLAINGNTGQALAGSVETVGGFVTITNNTGFSDAGARAFISQTNVVGNEITEEDPDGNKVTIQGNSP